LCLFFIWRRPPSSSTLFPYTTLFRSLDVPGFDEPGIFYVSSGNSIDAIGAEHKLHELLGRWGSGSEFSPGADVLVVYADPDQGPDRKSTRLNSSHVSISYAVFCLKKK